MPTMRVGTYQLISQRIRPSPFVPGSFGANAVRLIAQNGISISEPLVVIVYDGELSVGKINIDGTQLTAHYPRSSCLTHLEILQTEAPVFFIWAVDPAGEVTGTNISTGAEVVGEGLVDNS